MAGHPDDALTIFAGSRHHHFHLRYEGGTALAETYQARCLAAIPEPAAAQATSRGEHLTLDALIELANRAAQPAK